jgi:alpha,alpha-trehalase
VQRLGQHHSKTLFEKTHDYRQEADRLARKFVSLVKQDFEAHGTIVEKYDVRRRSSDLGEGLKFVQRAQT